MLKKYKIFFDISSTRKWGPVVNYLLYNVLFLPHSVLSLLTLGMHVMILDIITALLAHCGRSEHIVMFVDRSLQCILHKTSMAETLRRVQRDPPQQDQGLIWFHLCLCGYEKTAIVYSALWDLADLPSTIHLQYAGHTLIKGVINSFKQVKGDALGFVRDYWYASSIPISHPVLTLDT